MVWPHSLFLHFHSFFPGLLVGRSVGWLFLSLSLHLAQVLHRVPPTCPHPGSTQCVTQATCPDVIGSSGSWPLEQTEQKQLGVGSCSQVNQHPHSNSTRVGWVSPRELEQGTEARSYWEWSSRQPLEDLKQGQLLP